MNEYLLLATIRVPFPKLKSLTKAVVLSSLCFTSSSFGTDIDVNETIILFNTKSSNETLFRKTQLLFN
jgi:hypothetical protein